MIISKSKLKARMLAVFREVEASGEELIVTDHGRPALRITRVPRSVSADELFSSCRGKVSYVGDILEPTGEEWGEL